MSRRRNSRRSAADHTIQRAETRPNPPTRYRVLLVGVFLLLAVGLVFGQTFRHPFVFDDRPYVSENPRVSEGLTLRGIAWVFTHAHGGNWHPLTGLSHLLDCQLFGLRAGWHHLVNIVLHAATAVLLFLVLRRMTGRCWPSAWWLRLGHPPAPRGIGCLGGGTQGRAERTVLHVDSGGIRPVRAGALFLASVFAAGRASSPWD